MYKVDSKERTRQIFNVCENCLESFSNIGMKKWGNPSGSQQILDVYEIRHKDNTIWIYTVEWVNASTGVANRCGIITALPDYSNNPLGQILEVNMPYYFSKSFNTRVYEDNNIVEIRNYGKFTIGRRGLKKQYFFDYLREYGYYDEIYIDEEGKEYICIIKLQDNSIAPDYFGERLIKWTMILKEYKDYYRNLYSRK